MNYKFIPGIIVLVAFALGANAQDSTMSFTLKEAQDYASEHYFESVNAKMDIDKAQKKIWETTAIGLPQINASSDFQYVFNPPDPIMFPLGNDQYMEVELVPEQNLTYGVTISQLIFSGEYIVGLQASRVYKTLSEEAYEEKIISVKENIASTYFAILVLKDNLNSLDKMIENLETTSKDLQEYSKVGLIDNTDADQISLTLKSTQNSRISIQNQVKALKKLLAFQLGLESDKEIKLKENLDELIVTNIVDETSYQFNLDNNINYQMLETQEELMRLDLNRYKTKFLPQFSGFYSYSDQTKESMFSPSLSLVGVSASWNLFSSGQKMAVVSQAKIEHEKAVLMKQQQSEMIKIAAIQAIDNYKTASNKYINEKSKLELAEKIFNDTNEKYRQGMVSSSDLAQVNNQFLESQMSYSLAVQELLTAKVELDKTHNKL